jgi:nucleoside-diphosphate-sugar epimerase
MRNARIRDEGTRSLAAAAVNAGVQRLIAQSIAFAYADGPLPHDENDPLNIDILRHYRVCRSTLAAK